MEKVENKVIFIDYCINSFAEKFDMTPKEAYAYLNRYKGLEFLDECYAAEHLLSIRQAVNDLVEVCNNNGGELK